uniref:Secreted protein n=1 Tax=Steinernema glaseri TaxID=37863 RepID=A0A1I7YTP4_9BILA
MVFYGAAALILSTTVIFSISCRTEAAPWTKACAEEKDIKVETVKVVPVTTALPFDPCIFIIRYKNYITCVPLVFFPGFMEY